MNEKIETKKKKSPVKKVLLIILLIVLALVIAVCCMLHNELSSVMSLKQLTDGDPSREDGKLYAIDIAGDYHLDEFIEQGGVENDDELLNFLISSTTMGLVNLDLHVADFACSSFSASTVTAMWYLAEITTMMMDGPIVAL